MSLLRARALEPQMPALPAPEEDTGLQIQEYLRLLRRRWPLIVGMIVASLVAALVLYKVSAPQFRATTQLQIGQSNYLSLGTERNPWIEAWASVKYYPTQYEILKSRGLAERVVTALGLLDDPKLSLATHTDLTEAEARTLLAGRLRSGLTVKPIEQTELVELSYSSSDPQLAARIANAYAEQYIEWDLENRSQSHGQATTFLREQIGFLKEKIETTAQQQRDLAKDTDIVDGPGNNLALSRLEQLNAEYTGATNERIMREAQYRALLDAPDDTVADQATAGLVNQLREDLVKKQAEHQRLGEIYKPDWPAMVALKSEIANDRAQLDKVISEQAASSRQRAEAEYLAARRQEASLAAQVRRQREEAAKSGSAGAVLRNLEVEVEKDRELLADMYKQLAATGFNADLQSSQDSTIRIIDRALVPTAPFRPSLRQNLSLGVGAGLAIGIALVLLLQVLDRSIKTPEELEKALGHPVLAVIPDVSVAGKAYGKYRSYGYGSERRESKRSRKRRGAAAEEPRIELLPLTKPRLAVSEAYRSLRTALLLSSASELKTVTITSAEASEGKTATATNLAVVMAQLGKRVLLVDADLRRPRLHKVLAISNRVGLVSFLTRQTTDASALIVPSAIENLSVCPSGPNPPNPSELLASQRMREFVTYGASRFDFVVVDSPPILAVTDAILPATIGDGVVLCLRAQKTVREDVRTCRNILERADVHILGAVLNRYLPSGNSAYGRRYRYYNTYSDAAAAADSAANPAA